MCKNVALFGNGLKIEIYFGKGREHCGKRRKCWSSAFSPFPTMFLGVFFFFRVVKSWDCVVKRPWEISLLKIYWEPPFSPLFSTFTIKKLYRAKLKFRHPYAFNLDKATILLSGRRLKQRSRM